MDWQLGRNNREALSKVLIFVDEADTQFGGVGPDAHETERRLTGKVQAMMSDSRLKGKVHWLLMTARIHLLSPDIRRPGRVGDLIIPILDPEGDDRKEFVKWAIAPVLKPGSVGYAEVERLTASYSAASFASLRSELVAKAKGEKMTMGQIFDVAVNILPPAIELTRRYQELQALVNCTRRNLLPEGTTSEKRVEWAKELQMLEIQGIR